MDGAAIHEAGHVVTLVSVARRIGDDARQRLRRVWLRHGERENGAGKASPRASRLYIEAERDLDKPDRSYS